MFGNNMPRKGSLDSAGSDHYPVRAAADISFDAGLSEKPRFNPIMIFLVSVKLECFLNSVLIVPLQDFQRLRLRHLNILPAPGLGPISRSAR
jgi:hypothetical protein